MGGMNMTKKAIVLGVAVLATMVGAARASAQVPAMLPVQGFLTDTAGVPVEGSTMLTFALYDAETGGTMLYTEDQSLTLTAGRFSGAIGNAGTLDVSTFRDVNDVWVGITIEGGTELPRFELGTVPYAAYAEYAGEASTLADIPGCTSGQVLQWNGTAWVCATVTMGGSVSAGTGLTLTGTTLSINPSETQARVSGTCPAGQSIRAIASDGTVTCEADDNTTYMAGLGLNLTGTTFAIDPTDVQARVTGTCAAGESIRAISATGTVTCEPDNNTTYAAGAGLTLTGTTFAVDPTMAQSRVTGTCPAGQSIRAIAANGTVTCEADDDTTYTAGTGILISAGNAIGIRPDGVGAPEISAGAVGATELAPGTVNEAHLNLGSAGIVSSTTDEVVFARFLTSGATNGITAGRIVIATGGSTGRGAGTPGGAGTATVRCGATTVATISVSGPGTRAWTYVSPSFSWAANCDLDVLVRASAAGSPVVVREISLQPGH
jgi:hypothetical protein